MSLTKLDVLPTATKYSPRKIVLEASNNHLLGKIPLLNETICDNLSQSGREILHSSIGISTLTKHQQKTLETKEAFFVIVH
jgi:hypothetical protein